MAMIFRRQKCAQMMIEPPGNRWRGAIFEIDNRVLIAGKILFVEQRSRAVDQSTEFILCVRCDAFAMKACKQRGGTGSIETLIVIENTYFHLRTTTPCATINWPRYSIGLKQLALLALGDVSSERAPKQVSTRRPMQQKFDRKKLCCRQSFRVFSEVFVTFRP
jgi:hypothetical protein